MTSVYDACRQGDIKLVQSLLKTTINYWYCLTQACVGGHIDIVKLLIAKDPTMNLNNGLIHACGNGHIDLARFLIKEGADELDASFREACYCGSIEIVKLLIDLGVNDWTSGLFNACISGSIEIINLMLSNGANPCASLERCIITSKNAKIAKILIENGAEIRGYCAWPNNQLVIVQLLYLGIPLSKFQNIQAFQKLQHKVESVKTAIKSQAVLIPDLLTIISCCIVV